LSANRLVLAVVCLSRPFFQVVPVPAFKLAGIAGLLYRPRQPIPKVWGSAAKEAAPEIVTGSLRPYSVAGHVPRISAIFHFDKPFFTVLTALIIQGLKDLHLVGPFLLSSREGRSNLANLSL
jgi:hypothetical protein